MTEQELDKMIARINELAHKSKKRRSDRGGSYGAD